MFQLNCLNNKQGDVRVMWPWVKGLFGRSVNISCPSAVHLSCQFCTCIKMRTLDADLKGMSFAKYCGCGGDSSKL